MPRYDPKRIEPKWQQYWEQNETFRTNDLPGEKPKLYVLDMFPYPSGDGLHVGHPEGYTATDIVCRYNRMQGCEVLHPMGWDAFGLPAEQHAIKTGTHPSITTYKNIETFRRQLKMLGFSYDWSRELSTTDPDYLRWTQWIFLQIFNTWYDPEFEWTGPDGKTRQGKGRPIAELPIPDDVESQGDEAVRRYQDKHRLAYQHEAPVNWCSALGTVLSNEEVDASGLSERGQHPVERIPLRQWMLRITAYADRLGDELNDLDWTESIKLLQRNWIGRSEGAEVDFYIGQPGEGETSAESHTGEDFNYWKAGRTDHGFPTEPPDDVIRVYTTRPDTLYGATYMVIAPEHPFVERLTVPENKSAVDSYCRQAALKSDLDRTDLAKEKSGVFTGSYAFNPVNGEQVPIWVADYVLISYGTGAIMAVPAHDERDFEFAQQYNLNIRCVVEPPELQQVMTGPGAGAKSLEEAEQRSKAAAQKLFSENNKWREEILAGRRCFAGQGIVINSGEGNNGLTTAEFKEKISAELHQHGLGKKAVNFRLRDWLFSRQHFWGEPFPIWHELDADGHPTGLLRTEPEEALPAELPENFNFKPHGRPDPPLDEAPDEWLFKTADDGTQLKRETNSMPQWAGSCWYYIRFIDPKNDQQFIDPEKEKAWLPVDLYIGGAEHAVLHLLYARFWHKVLFDRGHLSTPEPFHKLVNQGMILGEAELTGFRNEKGDWVSAQEGQADDFKGERVSLASDQVEKKGEGFVLQENPSIVVDSRAYKMSKSRGNVINPDDVVEQYGADSLRLYEMFMGPLEQVKPWNMAGVEGVSRFLGRVWRMIADDRADEIQLSLDVKDVSPTDDQLRILHKTIKAVTDDIEKLSLNTAISRMMEFTNEVGQQKPRPIALLAPFVQLLSPFAPHLCEELWELLGHGQTITYEPWPEFDESRIVESEIEIPVQVNGKLRAKVKIPVDADKETMQKTAESAVATQLEGKNVVKTIVVPGRMVNFVVKG